MRIEKKKLESMGFHVSIRETEEVVEIYPRDINRDIGDLLRKETGITSLQTEEILCQIGDFQIWNAICDR